MKQENRDYIIFTAHIKNRKTPAYYLCFPDKEEYYADLELLPPTTFLCCGYDGEAIVEAKIDGKKRRFVGFNWLLNEYKNDSEWHERISTRLVELKQRFIENGHKSLRDTAQKS